MTTYEMRDNIASAVMKNIFPTLLQESIKIMTHKLPFGTKLFITFFLSLKFMSYFQPHI